MLEGYSCENTIIEVKELKFTEQVRCYNTSEEVCNMVIWYKTRAWLWFWSINNEYTKLDIFLPKSEPGLREILMFEGNFDNFWNGEIRNAELTNIWPIFTISKMSKVKVVFRKTNSILDIVKWSGKFKFSHLCCLSIPPIHEIL